MIQSGDRLILAETTPQWNRSFYVSNTGVGLVGSFASYAAIYRAQLWVYVVVNKLSIAAARLPVKVYEPQEVGRSEVDDPYSRLLAKPNTVHDPFFFWAWTFATWNIYGEAFWVKIRDGNGKPAELWPMHPANVAVRQEDDGTLTYVFYVGSVSTPRLELPQRDVVHFKFFNPDSTHRGLSPLEPLRLSLASEDAARRASFAFWKNAGRPSVALVHPQKISQDAANRLKANWDEVHQGVDNFGKAAVLEEGLTPQIISLSAEEAQYIESRKLNREEACAAYDVPPPVVHILDHATYSNITEQMRSLYRDTMAPRLSAAESVLETQLQPEFGETYAEFLMDDVLRGDFEMRVDSYQKGINSGWLKPSEARAKENLSDEPGADRLFINSTVIPIDEVSSRTSPNEPATDVPPNAPLGEPGQAPQGTAPVAAGPKALTPPELRRLMGRLSRQKTLSEVDPDALVKGLNGSSDDVLGELEVAKLEEESVEQFRERLKALVHTDPMVEVAKSLAAVASRPITINNPPAEVNVKVDPPDVTIHNSPREKTVKTIHRDKDGQIRRIEEG